MERIPPLAPPYDPGLAAELSAMMPPGVPPLRLFRALAHNPRVLRKIRLANLLDGGSLARADRELAILRTCARCGSEYEWGVHVAFFGPRYGLSPEKLAGTATWDADDPRWSPHERVLVRLADELHEHATLGDALWEAVRAEFATDQIVELLVLVGFYHTISFVTNGLALEREEGSASFPARPARTAQEREKVNITNGVSSSAPPADA